VTFRELAAEYLHWLEDVKGAKPSTLRDHRCLLAEPGQAYRRGSGSSPGLILSALGDRPTGEVTTREIEDLLRLPGFSQATGVLGQPRATLSGALDAGFLYPVRWSS
jgi:hypothetical protein